MNHKYLLGIYDDDDALLHAVKKIRKEGIEIHEVLTPFPVHGLDEAMGLQDTRLHTIGFVFGALGTMTAFSLMTFVGVVDWPIIVGGKPYFNFPAMGPIMFELTVLFCAVGMTIVYYIRNGFSVFRDPEIVHRRSTDDAFVTVFCLKKYHTDEDISRIKNLLKQSGAVIEERAMNDEIPANAFKEEGAVIEEHHH